MKEEKGNRPNVSDTLEEAAEKCINESLFKWSYDDEDGIEQYVHDAFIAGAKWQMEQMMEEWLKDRDGCFWDGVEEGKKAMEIHIDNPNIQKVDPDVKISTSDSSAGGDELLYVSQKSYNIGYRDGKAEAQKPAGWKPSEEQMEALKRASTNEYISAKQFDILVSLYKQLKAIREESK